MHPIHLFSRFEGLEGPLAEGLEERPGLWEVPELLLLVS